MFPCKFNLYGSDSITFTRQVHCLPNKGDQVIIAPDLEIEIVSVQHGIGEGDNNHAIVVIYKNKHGKPQPLVGGAS